MGWASLLEDNEKLRSHWDAIHATIDTLSRWPKESRHADPRHADFRADDLAARIKGLIGQLDKMLDGIYDDAMAKLRQPGVALVKRVDKKGAQLESTRVRLNEATEQLSTARQENEKLRARCDALSSDKAALEQQVATLTHRVSDNDAWMREVEQTQARRKR